MSFQALSGLGINAEPCLSGQEKLRFVHYLLDGVFPGFHASKSAFAIDDGRHTPT